MQNKRYLPLLVFVAISLSVTQFYFARDAVYRGKHLDYKINTFLGFKYGMKFYKEKVHHAAWKGRIFSNLIPYFFMEKLKVKDKKVTAESLNQFVNTAAGIHAWWIFLTFLVIIAFSKNRLLFIFGLFACLCYSWTPSEAWTSDYFLMPWDGSTVFWWTLLLFLSRNPKHYLLLYFLFPIATGFTEKTILFTIIPLFWNDWSMKNRKRYSVKLFVLCAAVKIICDIIVDNPLPLMTLVFHYDNVNQSGNYWLISQNLMLIFRSNLNHVLFAVGGVWVGIFFLGKKAYPYMAVAAIYFVIFMIGGVLTEFRLWHEFIPLFFIGLEESVRCGN